MLLPLPSLIRLAVRYHHRCNADQSDHADINDRINTAEAVSESISIKAESLPDRISKHAVIKAADRRIDAVNYAA